jgi:hypothetical protein
MSYSRPLRAGVALKQTPADAPGIQQLRLDSDIASTVRLGVVQVGSGLSITPAGILSTVSTGTDLINVKLTAEDYTASLTDYYVGATEKNITITLPLGVVGKVYYVKNQANGSIKVTGTAGETLDASAFRSLGSEAAITCVFDGTRWNII